MGAERDFEPAPESRAIDGGDHGLREILHPIDHRGKDRLRGRLAELPDVGAADEGPSRPGDDEPANRLVAGRPVQRDHEAAADIPGQRIHRGIVDGDDEDVTVDLAADGVGEGKRAAGHRLFRHDGDGLDLDLRPVLQ